MEKNQLEENLDKYFTAVEKVRRQNDRDKEEKLKRLLEPIINLQNDLSTQERRHKFAREDYINLEEEIDLSSLEKKSEDWAILSNWKLGQFGDIDTNDDIITVNYPKFLSEAKNTFSQTEDSMIRTSIRSLYKDWLPQLSQTRIQSKSLLDQILVCYTIKRAQNGDKQASDKLISLYSARAASKETYDNVLKILVWRENNNDVINKFYTNVLKQLTWPEKHKEEEQENKPQDQFYNYDVDDFQQIAKIYLAFIIRGFSPKSILDSIIKEQQSEFLPLPLGIGDVFLYYYGEYLPGIVAKYTTYLN
nr:hypothetical protein [Paludibacter sp.]